MASLQLTAALLGVGLSLAILAMVRRDHLRLGHGLFWLVVAIVAALLGLVPKLLDVAAVKLGIASAPNLLFILSLVVLFIKALHGDMVNTRTERQLRRLNQRLALFEAECRAAQGRAPVGQPASEHTSLGSHD
ncbi:MAG: DUF2304 domain-containing protein [Rhodocyclaceae bacterium]